MVIGIRRNPKSMRRASPAKHRHKKPTVTVFDWKCASYKWFGYEFYYDREYRRVQHIGLCANIGEYAINPGNGTACRVYMYPEYV